MEYRDSRSQGMGSTDLGLFANSGNDEVRVGLWKGFSIWLVRTALVVRALAPPSYRLLAHARPEVLSLYGASTARRPGAAGRQRASHRLNAIAICLNRAAVPQGATIR